MSDFADQSSPETTPISATDWEGYVDGAIAIDHSQYDDATKQELRDTLSDCASDNDRHYRERND